MKKIVIMMLAIASMSAVYAQTPRKAANTRNAQTLKADTAQFMRECRQFDHYVRTTPVNKAIIDSLAVCQDTLIAHYHAVKPKLNDKQIEEYNRAKGRYARCVIEYKGEKVGDGLKATGDSIAKAAGKVGNVIGGYFKGIFGR